MNKRQKEGDDPMIRLPFANNTHSFIFQRSCYSQSLVKTRTLAALGGSFIHCLMKLGRKQVGKVKANEDIAPLQMLTL